MTKRPPQPNHQVSTKPGQLHCAYGQGYYLASPLAAENMIEFFRQDPSFSGDAAFTSAA